jgi:hypothetical protein
MYTVLLIVIICGIIHGISWKMGVNSPATIPFLIGILSFMTFFLFISIKSSNCPYVLKVIDSQEIYALRDSYGTEGNFFLGCGNIDEATYYYYYVKDEKMDALLLRRSDAQNAYIREAKEQPRIDTLKKIPAKTVDNKWWVYMDTEEVRHCITIPPHSILYDYKVDMK